MRLHVSTNYMIILRPSEHIKFKTTIANFLYSPN